MYLYIHSILFSLSLSMCARVCSIHFLCSRETYCSCFWLVHHKHIVYGFPEMVFLIKLVHFGRYSFLFCASLCVHHSRECHARVFHTVYKYIHTPNGIFKNIYKNRTEVACLVVFVVVIVIFVVLHFTWKIPYGEVLSFCILVIFYFKYMRIKATRRKWENK